MVLDKSIVSGLNQARVLFETIAGVVPAARIQLPTEHTQLAAITRKMLDISKAAASVTPPVSTPVPEKKDVSVSLHHVLLSKYRHIKIFFRTLASRQQEIQVRQDHHSSSRRRAGRHFQCRRRCHY